jgi:hypothetical protein
MSATVKGYVYKLALPIMVRRVPNHVSGAVPVLLIPDDGSQVVVSREEWERRSAVFRAILDDDWAGLVRLARKWGCLPHRTDADNVSEYVTAGEYENDARYVYPTRTRLLAALAGFILGTEGGGA